jgi:hypothetical protein
MGLRGGRRPASRSNIIEDCEKQWRLGCNAGTRLGWLRVAPTARHAAGTAALHTRIATKGVLDGKPLAP